MGAHQSRRVVSQCSLSEVILCALEARQLTRIVHLIRLQLGGKEGGRTPAENSAKVWSLNTLTRHHVHAHAFHPVGHWLPPAHHNDLPTLSAQQP